MRNAVGAAIASALLSVAVTPGYAQLLYSEDFTTTTSRDDDPGQTTAEWNTTVPGSLVLPESPSLTGTTFDATTLVEVIPGSFVTRSVALADLNGDGDLDLIDGTRSLNGVHLNDGTGNFGARVYTGSEFANTRAVAVGDVDRDGDLDFVAGNFSDPSRLYLNDGTGTGFEIQDITDRSWNTDDIALADINGDGLLDVVLANTFDDQQYQQNVLVLNTGDPITPFGPEGSVGRALEGGTEDTWGVVTGDLDNDGDIDIVFMNLDDPNPTDNNRVQRNRVLMNLLDQGSLDFADYEIDLAGGNEDESRGGALGDLDGDGFLDLVVINFSEGQESKIYLNGGLSVTPNDNPFTQLPYSFTSAGVPPTNALSASLADADNDGDLDIFMTIEGTAFKNRIYFNDGGGIFPTFVEVGPDGQAPLALGTVAPASRSGAVGDVDGDGDLDWVVGNEEGEPGTEPMENVLFRNDGSASGVAAMQLTARATSITIPNTAGVSSVKLLPVPDTSNVGPDSHNEVDYWVSGDGGSSWSVIGDDGRPVTVAGGAGLQWRGILRSGSPATADSLAINRLDISQNMTGPVFNTDIVSVNVIEGDNVTNLPIVANASDNDGDTIWYSISCEGSDPTCESLPAGTGFAIDPLTGVISGTPTNEDSLASPINVTVTATDGSRTASDTFTLTVQNTNDNPEFTSVAETAAIADVVYSYAITTSDPDLVDIMTITAPIKPAWLTTFTDNGDGTATLSGTPTIPDVGDHPVQLVVEDNFGGIGEQNFTISVINVNDPPVITSNAVTEATEDALYSYAITTSDPDPGPLIITAPTKPAWLTTFTDNGDGTATLGGTPTILDVGDHPVQLVVDDGEFTDEQNFTITVANINDPPVFTSTAVTDATQDAGYNYAITTDDPDADAVIITAPTRPVWLSLTDNGDGTATLSGTPTFSDVGPHQVQLVVDDGEFTDEQNFTITVANVNDAPVFTSVPVTAVTEGATYSYTVTVVDPDLDAVSIAALTLPAWLTLTDNGDGTATITGAPTGAEVGGHAVEISAQENAPAPGLASSQSFSITVTAAADGPVIELNGAATIRIAEGGAFSDPGATASDPQDGDLTAQIVVNNPVNVNVPGTYSILYSVEDTAGNAAQVQRTVIVEASSPPTQPSGGGGGSSGLIELFMLALGALTCGAGRRRRWHLR